MQLDLDALIDVQSACQSSERTDVGTCARGNSGYDVRMPFTVWHAHLVDGRDPHRDSRPLGACSRGPFVGIESRLFATPKHRQSSPANLQQ